jgi:hypothetical protein
MNETYLIITGVLLVYSIIQFLSPDFYRCGEFRGVTTALSFGIGALMVVLSAIIPIGDDIIEIKSATNTKIGNELIIQADGFPTQVIDNIKFIDQPVQVRKTQYQNAWGGGMNTRYEVELKQVETN